MQNISFARSVSFYSLFSIKCFACVHLLNFVLNCFQGQCSILRKKLRVTDLTVDDSRISNHRQYHIFVLLLEFHPKFWHHRRIFCKSGGKLSEEYGKLHIPHATSVYWKDQIDLAHFHVLFYVMDQTYSTILQFFLTINVIVTTTDSVLMINNIHVIDYIGSIRD